MFLIADLRATRSISHFGLFAAIRCDCKGNTLQDVRFNDRYADKAAV
jgi:hypothetical protein